MNSRSAIQPLKQIVAAVLLCIALAPPGHSETLGHAENLSQIYALAKQNDPRMRAAKLEFEAVAYGVDKARGGFLPTIAADYDSTWTHQHIRSSQNAVYAHGITNYSQVYEALTLTQPVFRLAAWAGYSEAKASEREAAATFAAAQQDLIMRTVTAYVGVLEAEKALTFVKAEQAAVGGQLKLTKNKFAMGLTTRANLLDVEARAALKQSDAVAAQFKVDDKIQALRQIIGTDVTDLVPLSEDMPLIHPDPPDMEKWVKASMDKNLTIEAHMQAVAAANEELFKQRSGYFPTLDMSADIYRQNTGGSLFGGGSKIQNSDVMLRLHVPIFSGLKTRAASSAAAKRHEEAEEKLERTRRLVERQARAAYRGIEGGIERIKALTLTVKSLEAARQLKERSYRSGVIPVLGVLDAVRDLYAAKRDLARARYNYVLNSLKLKQAAGTLSDEDVAIVGRMAQ